MNNEDFKDNIKNHKLIKVSFIEKILIMLFYYVKPLKFICPCWKKEKDLVNMFRMGKNKIDANLSIVGIMYNINIMKTFMKYCVISDKARWMVAHCQKNTLNLDTSCEEETSSEDE